MSVMLMAKHQNTPKLLDINNTCKFAKNTRMVPCSSKFWITKGILAFWENIGVFRQHRTVEGYFGVFHLCICTSHSMKSRIYTTSVFCSFSNFVCFLQIRYRPHSPLVLKNIACWFEGGRKVGVVGRTGSGKTTLISALFRLVEPAGGRILVDGIDITTIGLHDLRFKLCIIPQEPVLFRGTVRTNLDPLNQFTDLDIWEVITIMPLQKLSQTTINKS